MSNGPTQLEAIADAFVDFTIATLLLAMLTALVLQAIYDFWLRRRINYATTHDWLEARWSSTRDRMIELLSRRNASGESEKHVIKRMRNTASDSLLREIGVGIDSAIYALPFPQTCAQIGAALNSAIDWRKAPLALLAFSGLDKGESDMRTGPRIPENPLDNNLRWAAWLVIPETAEAGKDRDWARQAVMSRIEHAIDELQSEMAAASTKSVYKWSLGLSIALLVVLVATAAGLRIDLSSLVIFPFMIAAAALLVPPLQRLVGRLLDAG